MAKKEVMKAKEGLCIPPLSDALRAEGLKAKSKKEAADKNY